MPARRRPGTVRDVGRSDTLVDSGLAAAAFAFAVLVLATSEIVDAGIRDPAPLAYVLAAVYCGSLVLCRRRPELAVITGFLAGFAYASLSYPIALVPIPIISVYRAATLLPPRRSRLLAAGAVLVGWLTTTVAPGPTDLSAPALIVAAWALGSYVGGRRAYTADLEAKNRALEAAQRELADQAVTEERLRIARELHDVVAHTMSVVAVHAGTGRMVADEDPAAARQALATIEESTRSALLEMRQLLGVLRGSTNDDTGRTPAPGLDALDALVADVATSGVTVDVHIEGERRDVPPGIDLSAYRIVQEALTNVIKHAGPVRATVVVRYTENAVTVEVDDDGPGPPATVTTAGHGLAGMAERVALYGGRLEHGARSGGGFRVRAHLPYGEAQ